MTRDAIRAEQDDDTGPPPRLTRVTVVSIQDQTVTVQLPGGSMVTAPRVAGGVYTPGGLAYVFLQQPAVGPVLAAGPATTASNFTCHAVWGNTATDPAIAGGGWSNIPNTQVETDLYGMRQSDGITFKVPLSGRYSLHSRIALTGDDTGTGRSILGWFDATLNTDIAWAATGPVRADVPISMHAEAIIASGDLIRPRYFRDSTSTQYIRHFVGAWQIPQVIIRYLGPA